MGIIYCARNLINGKRYIGQTVSDLNSRKWGHEWYALPGNREKLKGCSAFINALRKYGLDSFEWTIIFDDVAETDLNDFEIDAIEVYGTLVPNGYNLKEGGAKGKLSAETRKKMSESHKGVKRGPHSEETKKKMSASKTGRKLPPFSEEHRRKLSESLRKRHQESPASKETRKKMNDTRKRRCQEELLDVLEKSFL